MTDNELISEHIEEFAIKFEQFDPIKDKFIWKDTVDEFKRTMLFLDIYGKNEELKEITKIGYDKWARQVHNDYIKREAESKKQGLAMFRKMLGIQDNRRAMNAAKEVTIDGVTYKSKTEAAEHFGISVTALNKRLKKANGSNQNC